MTQSQVEFTIEQNPPNRLDKALFRDAPEAADLSRTQLARMIEAGQVRVDGAVETNVKAKVPEGALVRISIESAKAVDTIPENIPLCVVHEDSDVIVVNKPAGMVVHPAPGSPSGTLVNALLYHCRDSLSGIGGEKRPGIVHRIDKDTSGLLVVAKNDKAHHALAKQFADHSVERLYKALCYGVPDTSEPRLRGLRGVSFEAGAIVKITTQLARHKTDRQRQAVIFEGGRHAVTRLRVDGRFGNPDAVALVSCWLETGRTHQIRAHMAHIGHGLIGDPVYGRARKIAKTAFGFDTFEKLAAFPRQALHAAVLGFVHPNTGESMRFEVEMPQDMASLMRDLHNTNA